MDQSQIHFEVFARRAGGDVFRLELACEDRERALETARDMLDGGKFAAVKVTKEARDADTGAFSSVTIFKEGEEIVRKSKTPAEDPGPACVSPTDLYNVHARDRIGRLLEGWLARNKVTPFELLHRADLLDKLEASGVELQHALQKISVPEAQERGVGVHEVMRHFHKLVERGIEKVVSDQRKGRLPDLHKEALSAVCTRLAGDPERGYYVGAGVAGFIGSASTWAEKVDLLLDLAERAPVSGAPRGLAFSVLEQPLGEILQSRVGMTDLLGAELDLGASLGALTRLAAGEAVDALAAADAAYGRLLPALQGPAERLSRWLEDPAFKGVRLALCKRILAELGGVKRLRPSDARGEIDILRALAMALTAASGPLLPLDEVREAFIHRCRMLVAADFVDAFLAEERTAVQEVIDLIWLLENVTGGANKRQALRWVLTSVTSLRFESEMMSGAESPSTRIAQLADLYRQTNRAGGAEAGVGTVLEKISDLAGRLEAAAKLTAALARAPAPPVQKLGALIRMATGESAPPGPAAERAKSQALQLMRLPEVRADLGSAPEVMAQVRALMSALEAAA